MDKKRPQHKISFGCRNYNVIGKLKYIDVICKGTKVISVIQSFNRKLSYRLHRPLILKTRKFKPKRKINTLSRHLVHGRAKTRIRSSDSFLRTLYPTLYLILREE